MGKKFMLVGIVALLFSLSGSFVLAQNSISSNTNYKDFESFVKKDIGVDIHVYEKADIPQQNKKQVASSFLKDKLAKYDISGGNISSISNDAIPENIQVISFNNENDAAKYIVEYIENDQTVGLSNSAAMTAMVLTSYTRNYKVLVERPTPLNRIDINTRGTYSTSSSGYSYFTTVQSPWFTFSGVTVGMEVVTNSTWKTLVNGGLSAQIGGSYTKKQYILINGFIQLYSTTKNTTKTITPTGS